MYILENNSYQIAFRFYLKNMFSDGAIPMETGSVYYLYIYAVKVFKIWEIDEDWKNVSLQCSNSLHLVYISLRHFTDIESVHNFIDNSHFVT